MPTIFNKNNPGNESSYESYYILNENLEYIYIHKNFVTLNEQESSEPLIGKNIFEINPSLIGTKFETEYRLVQELQTPRFFKFFHPTWKVNLDVRVFPHEDGIIVYFKELDPEKNSLALSDILKNCLDYLNEMVVISQETHLPDGEIKTTIIYVNQAFLDKTGFSIGEVIGNTTSFLHGPKTQGKTIEFIKSQIKLQKPIIAELINYKKNGKEFWVELDISPIIEDNGKSNYWISIQRDITQEKNNQEKIKRLAYFDPLTNLPNRSSFDLELKDLIRTSYEDEYSALLFIDLDNFKILNDTLGHSKGDELLKLISTKFEKEINPNDFVARLGGDEFIILLKNIDSNKNVAIHKTSEFVEDLLHKICDPVTFGTFKYTPSASIGVTFIGGEKKQAEEILQEADLAMYNAKEKGKNSFSIFNQSFKEKIKHKQLIEKQLIESLHKTDELILHFQPQYSGDQIIGSEGLIRWIHPIRGFSHPGAFLQIALESGLICQIDYYVLKKSFSHLEEWSKDPDLKTKTLSVNITAQTFLEDQFLDNFLAIASLYSFNRNLLKLEITENTFLDQKDHVIKKMEQIIFHGFSFSLDDFGTGYSSLAYLRKFPINEIKIDRSFVIESFCTPKDQIIIKSIIDMAQKLDINVVAEGVETDEQKNFLIANNCLKQQGYLYSKPIPESDYIALIKKEKNNQS